MEGHVYHWKHGWIPLTHTAAMVKAKGNRRSAAKYADRYGIGNERHRTHDRRQGGDLGPHERRKPGDERGTFQYKPGTRTRDYPQRHPQGPGVTGPNSESGAFKLKKAELEPHAKSGNVFAQAELDRRAAKHAKPAAAPKAAPAAPEAPRFGTQDPNPSASFRNAAKDAETKKALQGKTDTELGNIVRNLREGSAEHRMALAEIEHRRNTRVAPPEIPPTPSAPKIGPTSAQKVANAATMYGHGSPEHRAAIAEDDRRISAELGHTITGHPSLTTAGGIYSIHSLPSDGTMRGYGTRQIGSVSSRDGKTFTAEHYTYTPKGNRSKADGHLGSFASREEAHRALAAADVAHKAKAEQRVAKTAENNAKRAAALGSLNVAGPHGTTWEQHELPDDGTFMGRIQRAKVKAAYKAGPHTVVTEHHLTEAQTRELLADTTSVLEAAAPNLRDKEGNPIAVKVLVPTGDAHFSGHTGGYVAVGDTTIHLAPAIAKGGELRDTFRQSAHAGHFMPVAKSGSIQRYTLTHELGHVIDGQNEHSRPGARTNGTADFGPEAQSHWAAMKATGQHSKYGHDKPSEGYAEAFAQHQLGGGGSHPISDAYAAKYGWAEPPAASTADARALAANKARATARYADAASTGRAYTDAAKVGPPRVAKGFSSARPKTPLTASERAKPRQTGTFYHGTASRSSSNPTRRMGS